MSLPKKNWIPPYSMARISNSDLDTKRWQAKQHHNNDDQVNAQIEKILPGYDCPSFCDQIYNQAGKNFHFDKIRAQQILSKSSAFFKNREKNDQ